MVLAVVLSNSVTSNTILSFLENFWFAPRLGLVSRLVWRAVRTDILEFRGAYLQCIEHLADQDQRRCEAEAVGRYVLQQLIY